MNIESFKYKSEIRTLLDMGLEMPLLTNPKKIPAYRFVFSTSNINNHKPAYIQKPQRIITDRDKKRLNTSGYALSCFDKEANAIQKYESLKKNIKNIHRAIGDSLSKGVLDINDGMVTKINNEGHFDLYEFAKCNLSSKFVIEKELI